MYEIGNASGRKSAPRMSAFPTSFRPFTEPVTATEDKVIGANVDLAQLLKIYYPGTVPTAFTGKFGFLDRDNKIRTYDPGKTDKFVFKNHQSMQQFSKSAHRLIRILTTMWKDLSLPTKTDVDRKIEVPDSTGLLQNIADNGSSFHPDKLALIYFILANVDIMKKACIVRTVNAGWWAVSYAGKNAPNKEYFSKSLKAHKRAIKTLLLSQQGQRLQKQVWSESSDPLDTNPGYPFFTAQMDDKGNPTTRMQTVELFRNLDISKFAKWQDLLLEIDRRAGKYGMLGFPLCVAPIRRQQPGYKWQHQFNMNPSGLVTAFDERGVNSQRVAHMVPYIYNVITSPLSTLYKAARILLPGCYHDGKAKLLRMATLKRLADQKQLFLIEADYSNFDRFMAVDLIADIVESFTSLVPRSDFWYDAMMHLHESASMVWPDYSSTTSGKGWLFKPGKLGLLSGVKATSDTGTLVNSVVNGEALARTYNWSEDQLYNYLTQYASSQIGSKHEFFYVQSDDTQLIARTARDAANHSKHFEEAVKMAGLKGATEIADRFLMRHINRGCDRPVPARVWQNTLSNESPPPSEIIFLAGLTARTDGLFGQKTVDPFQTGALQPISAGEALFSLRIVEDLLQFIKSSSQVIPMAVEFLEIYTSMKGEIEAAYAKSPTSTWTCKGDAAVKLNRMRTDITQLLSKLETAEKSHNSPESIYSWLYRLYKDKHIPSSALMLEQLKSNSSVISSLESEFRKKEESFFQYATDTIGVKPIFI